ncbi:MAG: protein kinase [Planctomycetes bacterium]|nr:protein kinase [Planctomycetota bacterium]
MSREEDLFWYRTALDRGWASRGALQEIAARNPNRPLGEAMLAEGFVTDRQYREAAAGLSRPAAPERPLARVGPYRILGELRRSRSGVVYRARHAKSKREFALKVFDLPAGDRLERACATPDKYTARFAAEMRALLALEHPRIARVHEFGETEGRLWCALDLVLGETLREATARKGRFPPGEAAAIGAGLAKILSFIHEQGFAHRDLSPSSIILDRERGLPFLADFGFARPLQADAPDRGPAVPVDPAYLAPELAATGASEAGKEADVYGLGAILYDMLTGCPPVRGKSAVETLRRLAARKRPAPPSALAPGIPAALEDVVLAALSPDPARRPSAKALALDLARVVAGERPVSRPEPSLPRTLGRVWRRSWVGALWILALAALLAAGADYRARTGRPAERRREIAGAIEGEARRAAEEGDWTRATRLARAVEGISGDAERGRELDIALEELRRPVIDGLVLRAREHLAAGDALRAARTASWALSIEPANPGARQVLAEAEGRLATVRLSPATGGDLSLELLAAGGDGVELALGAGGAPSGRATGGRWARARVLGRNILPYTFDLELPAGGEIEVAPLRLTAGEVPPGWTLFLWVRRLAGRVEVVPDRLLAASGFETELANEHARAAGLVAASRAQALSWFSDPTRIQIGPPLGDGEGFLWATWEERERARTADFFKYLKKPGEEEEGTPAAPPLPTLDEAILGAARAAAGRDVYVLTRRGKLFPARLAGERDGSLVFLSRGREQLLAPAELYEEWKRRFLAADGSPEALAALGALPPGPDGAAPALPAFVTALGRSGPDPWKGSTLALFPGGEVAAVGTEHGDVVLVSLRGAGPARVLSGHLAAVRRIVWSKDGTRLASAREDRTVRVWSAKGEFAAILVGPGEAAAEISFDGNGGRLLARYGESEVRLWDARSGQELARFASEGKGIANISAAVFDPSSDRVALATRSGRIFFASGGSLSETSVLAENQGPLLALAFSRDGTRLAAASANGRIRLWDLGAKRPAATFETGEPPAAWLEFSPMETMLLLAGERGDCRTLGLDSGVLSPVAAERGEAIWGADFRGENNLLLGIGARGIELEAREPGAPPGSRSSLAAVRRVDVTPAGDADAWVDRGGRLQGRLLPGGSPIPIPDGHPGGASAVLFFPAGDIRLLMTGGTDGRALWWNLLAATEGPRIVEPGIGEVTAIDASPDGRHAAVAGSSGRIALLDLESGRVERTVDAHTGDATAVVYSPDGRILATAGEDTSAALWDPATGALLARLPDHSAPVRALVFAPDGKMLYTGSEDSTARLWALPGGRAARVLKGHSGAVVALALSGDGGTLAVGLSSGEIVFRDVRDPGDLRDAASTAEVGSFRSSTSAPVRMAFSPGGTFLWRSAWDGKVRAIRLAGGEIVASVPGVPFALDRVANRIYYGTKDGDVGWVRASDRAGPEPQAAHFGPVTALALSPSGRWLVTGGRDRRVAIRPGPSAGLRGEIAGAGAPVADLARIGDGAFAGDGALAVRTDGSAAFLAAMVWLARALGVSLPQGDLDIVGSEESLAAVAAGDAGVVLLDLPSGEEWRRFDAGGSVLSVALICDLGLAAAGTADGKVVLLDLFAGKTRETIGAGDLPVVALSFSGDGRLLFVAAGAEPVRVRDLGSGEWIGTLGRSAATSLSEPGLSGLLAVGTAAGAVEIYRTESGR